MPQAVGPPRAPRSDETPRRRSRSSRIVHIVAFDLALLLLLVETVPRLFDLPGLTREHLNPVYLKQEEARGLIPHPYISYVLRPSWSSPPERKKRATQGSHGFRGAAVPVEKPAGVFRIACLGGSSTYGMAVSDDGATWPQRLQQTLNRKAGDWRFEVLNFGAPGWGTSESLINLQLRGLAYEPDLVLVYQATNDVSTALWPNPVGDNTHYRAVWWEQQQSPLEPLLERSVLYLIWRRYCTDYFERWGDLGQRTIVNYDGSYRDPYGDGPFPDTGFETYERNLVDIVAVARAHGANVAFVTQAFRGRDDDDFVNGRNRARALRRALGIMRSVAEEREVALIDAASVLESEFDRQLAEEGQQTIFANNVHLRNPGALLLGRTIAEELRARGLVP